MSQYYTIWKVIDKAGEVLFEGLYGDAVQYIEKNRLVDIEPEPFMMKRVIK
tara:strand:- start:88 stop:240 length:153 start_codon:yes stop_codon:yes gene_type:complete